MNQITCWAPGCDIPVPAPGGAKGLCSKHYSRLQRHGDVNFDRPRWWRGTNEERFWAKVNKNGPVPARCPDRGPCWLWTAANNDGYGVFWVSEAEGYESGGNGHLDRAYRYAYEVLVKPIPADLELDHLCRNHACVNPAHLEPVPHRINLLRGESPSATHARKETCSEGHSYDLIENGQRRCSICRTEKRRKRDQDRRASGPPVACECGCGGTFRQVDRWGRARRFLVGHQTKRPKRH